MSKEQEYLDSRIPSYEESIATTTPQLSEKSSTRLSVQQRNRLKRARLVNDLTTSQLEPAISVYLEDGANRTTLILIPSDAFASNITVQPSNITSPALPPSTNVVRLSSDDHKSSFFHQPAVIQDLTSAIAAGLVDPSLLHLTASSPPTAPLPARPQPQQRSSLRYMLGMADSEKDPTGSTGQWNLGWRTAEDPSSTTATVTTSDVSVNTRLQDISYRTESEMGLLESKSVKCIWCEVELKA